MSESAVEAVHEDAPPSDLSSVGATLRSERERQGLSVADVAQRLKYAPRQIVAVETDDYAVLPGLTFVRGFVRSYARFLGLAADPLIAQLESTADSERGPTTVQLQAVMPTRATFSPAGAAPARAAPWLLATLAVVVGLGGYSLLRWDAPAPVIAPAPTTERPPASPNPATKAAAEDVVVLAPGALPPQPAAPEPAAVGEGQAPRSVDSVAAPAPATASGMAPLRLVFSGESWTEIRDADGRVLLSRKNAAGSEQTAEGRPPFDVVVGNARDVRLFYRGAEVDLKPHIKVSVARLTLN
ncbi:MAG: helix-turn-helix domain-containing protein [Burkholderiales bacterium]|nr:helix-turn-helix domain-containing protein [Burkholderiales bacterium]